MERFRSMNDANRDDLYFDTRRDVMELLQKRLRPEFLNRVEEVLVFHPLSRGDLHRIVEVQFERLVQSALRRQGLQALCTPAAKDWLVQHGYDPIYGARPLKRLMLKEVVNRISTMILKGEVPPRTVIHIDAKEDRLTFEPVLQAEVVE